MIHTSLSNHTPKITYIYQPTPQSHAYVYYNGFTYIYIYLFSMMINCTPCTPLNEVQNPSSTTNFVEISNYLDVSVQKNIPYFIQRKYVHIYIYVNRCSKQKQKQTLNLYIYTNVHTHTTLLIKKTFPKMVYTTHKKKRRKEKKTMTITYLVFYRSYIILL